MRLRERITRLANKNREKVKTLFSKSSTYITAAWLVVLTTFIGTMLAAFQPITSAYAASRTPSPSGQATVSSSVSIETPAPSASSQEQVTLEEIIASITADYPTTTEPAQSASAEPTQGAPAAPTNSAAAVPTQTAPAAPAESAPATPAQSAPSEPTLSASVEKTAEAWTYNDNIPLSAELQEYLYDLCAKRNVDFKMALAIIELESSFNPNAISKTNDYGLMQINICNHSTLADILGTENSPLDPKTNLNWGTYMLSTYVDEYGAYFSGDDLVHVIVSAYNMGDQGLSAYQAGRGLSQSYIGYYNTAMETINQWF